ncbi:MAG: hypothetical protein LH616_02240 [Ilumatobacteraceae bacterium]|nr:hypothetical protein [Ilumatobacteraceae bacterium]
MPGLDKRIEDGITDSASARANYEWTVAALGDKHLTRMQQGLLAAGAARALAGWRKTSTNPNCSQLLTKAVAVLDAIGNWSLCDDAARAITASTRNLTGAGSS